MFLVSTILPMVIGFLSKTTEQLKNTDTAKIFENPDMMSMMYRDPNFVNEIRKLLPILLEEGYLD